MSANGLRIGLVTYAMRGGGMEVFLLQLGRYLQRQGATVELVTTLEPGAWFGEIKRSGLAGYHIAGYTPGRRWLVPVQAWRVGMKLRQSRYDVIFVNHTTFAQASLALLDDRTFVVPVLHNDDQDVYNVGCANQSAWNALVADSPKVADEAKRRVARRPILYIPYGVELPSEIGFTRQAHTFPLRLVFVGRLTHHQKGILLLPAIIQGCREHGMHVSLDIFGDGPDRDQLRVEIAKSGVEDLVTLKGAIDHAALFAQLLSAHALLMPSFFEGLPITLLEALGCGCVPIVSRLPGTTDYVLANGAAGMLAEVGRVDQFVDAIAQLYSQPELWARKSAAARRHALATFSIARMGSQYVQLIEDGLAGKYPLPRSRRLQAPLNLSWLIFDRVRGVLP